MKPSRQKLKKKPSSLIVDKTAGLVFPQPSVGTLVLDELLVSALFGDATVFQYQNAVHLLDGA